MTVGQPVVVAFVLRQAVAVHLGQEAEMIGQSEVPDPRATGRRSDSRPPDAQGQESPMHAGGQGVRDINLDVQALALVASVGATAGKPSGTMGSGKGPSGVVTG